VGRDHVEINQYICPADHADQRRFFLRPLLNPQEIIMKKYGFILIIIALLILLPTIGEAQCSMCKAAVQSSMDQENSVARGINKGILYLMAVPYLLLAFIFRKQIASLWRNLRGKATPETSEE
jgi:hypothetical protein